MRAKRAIRLAYHGKNTMRTSFSRRRGNIAPVTGIPPEFGNIAPVTEIRAGQFKARSETELVNCHRCKDVSNKFLRRVRIVFRSEIPLHFMQSSSRQLLK